MRTADFDFPLPPELIAQHPTAARDASRLLVLDRQLNSIEHRTFHELPALLRSGDLLVLNDSRVIPARLRAKNRKSGGRFEILLLEKNSHDDWWAMMKPAKRAQVGSEVLLLNRSGEPCGLHAKVMDTNAEGHRRLAFFGRHSLDETLDEIGEVPLPPYIRREPHHDSPEDRARYQTVYANEKGSVAAPTAGLHFTDGLLAELEQRGIESCRVTLHVGPGTFAPVKADALEEHVMHHEQYSISPLSAEKINLAKAERRRVIAVGTTSVRVLESTVRDHSGLVCPGKGHTNIFIYPPFKFRIVDALITNFHLPQSTLLMLVSAFASPGETGGRTTILDAYRVAIQNGYRFFSYGDAMLVL